MFLPKNCEKCHIDYVRIPKKKDFCDYCGYSLEVKEKIEKDYKEFIEIKKIPIEKIVDKITEDKKTKGN